MDFLAEKVFSNNERTWVAANAKDVTDEPATSLYRGFYLNEYSQDPDIANLLQRQIKEQSSTLPSMTPHMEEKAILAFIWDSRFEDQLKKRLGPGTFTHLREIIPPNWIVGQEKHFAPGLPGNMTTSAGLANLSRSKRAFVLKPSGFSESSSWAGGG